MPDFYAGPHFMTNIACVRGVGNGGASSKKLSLTTTCILLIFTISSALPLRPTRPRLVSCSFIVFDADYCFGSFRRKVQN